MSALTDTRFVPGSVLDEHNKKYRASLKRIESNYADLKDLDRMITIL